MIKEFTATPINTCGGPGVKEKKKRSLKSAGRVVYRLD